MPHKGFVKGESYSFAQIEKFVNDEGSHMEEHGREVLGCSLIVVDEGAFTISFLLSHTIGPTWMYTCVFNE